MTEKQDEGPGEDECYELTPKAWEEIISEKEKQIELLKSEVARLDRVVMGLKEQLEASRAGFREEHDWREKLVRQTETLARAMHAARKKLEEPFPESDFIRQASWLRCEGLRVDVLDILETGLGMKPSEKPCAAPVSPTK